MKKVVKYGEYYNPATKHYNGNGPVICDRCFRNNLDICIGWETYDLCLPCVTSVNENGRHHDVLVKMMPRMFR